MAKAGLNQEEGYDNLKKNQNRVVERRKMVLLIIIGIGIIIGLKWFPKKWTRVNQILQLGITALLIFTMGVMLGTRPHLFEELTELGIDSLIYAILPIIGSVAAVYLVSKKFWPND